MTSLARLLFRALHFSKTLQNVGFLHRHFRETLQNKLLSFSSRRSTSANPSLTLDSNFARAFHRTSDHLLIISSDGTYLWQYMLDTSFEVSSRIALKPTITILQGGTFHVSGALAVTIAAS
eukprot:2120954-Amphidinium_carterae.1